MHILNFIYLGKKIEKQQGRGHDVYHNGLKYLVKMNQYLEEKLLCLDYIDCIVPDKNLGDEWKSEGSVMRAYEALCHELDVAGWTATQGNRSSISSDVVTTDQMGGSIKKAQVGHVIISVAKSLQQKEMKLATIAITKSRIGRDGIVFENCKFDNELMQIDTESSVTFLGLEEQKEERNRNRVNELLNKRKQQQEIN